MYLLHAYVQEQTHARLCIVRIFYHQRAWVALRQRQHRLDVINALAHCKKMYNDIFSRSFISRKKTPVFFTTCVNKKNLTSNLYGCVRKNVTCKKVCSALCIFSK